jgi:hypothetical protein
VLLYTFNRLGLPTSPEVIVKSSVQRLGLSGVTTQRLSPLQTLNLVMGARAAVDLRPRQMQKFIWPVFLTYVISLTGIDTSSMVTVILSVKLRFWNAK